MKKRKQILYIFFKPKFVENVVKMREICSPRFSHPAITMLNSLFSSSVNGPIFLKGIVQRKLRTVKSGVLIDWSPFKEWSLGYPQDFLLKSL